MKKIFKSKISIIALCLIALILVVCVFNCFGPKDKLVKVGSKANLESIYENKNSVGEGIWKRILAAFLFPWNIIDTSSDVVFDTSYNSGYDIFNPTGSIDSVESSGSDWWNNATSWYGDSSSSKDSAGVEGEYSTTNIQVENVDEADIIKTDGEYIYSISDFSVVITDVKDENNPVIVSEIETSGPEEILLYNQKLIIISTGNAGYTEVEIYNIADKANPYRIKNFSIKQSYYTSRVTNDNLYIISTGSLKEDSKDDVIAYYTEDSEKTYIGYNNMYYFKNNVSRYETIISRIDLKEDNAKFDVKAYLVDIDNIYVSQNNIYLAETTYKNDVDILKAIGSIFGFKGIYGLEDSEIMDYDYSDKTKIYKFELKENGKVEYVASTTIEGETIDQFSFDEYETNLRVAVDIGKATKVLVLDKDLNLIGETGELAEGENMYSSRFIGERAYLVTYQTIDPLFVLDLSNPEDPKVLGELKIPGYSTYLHPYDENHIIGIGMQTEEKIYRDSEGRVTSTTAVIKGMKMALFDVSNVNSPKQISEVTIGDSRTRSAVLTNHKALLFSKEKQLLAIPVNSYKVDMDDIEYNDDISKVISNYTKDYYGYVSEGYLVYNINLEEGINLKGLITHEGEEKTSEYYKNSSNKLLRGVYIKDYLYTVSQHMMQVHKLDTLEKVSDIEI